MICSRRQFTKATLFKDVDFYLVFHHATVFLCPVRPPQTAIGRPAGTLLGSAPVPVAVSGVAPKTAIPTGLNHSAQGCAGALPWVGVPQIFLPGTGCITSRQTG